MLTFLLIFFLVYGGLHGLTLWRIWPVLQGHQWVLLGSIAWSVAMVLAPILAWAFEDRDLQFAARAAGWVGFTWMALVFWMATILLALDAWNLLIWLVGRLHPPAMALTASAAVRLGIALALTATLALWGFIEARRLTVEELNLTVTKWDADHAPVTILYISDLHLGLLADERRLREIAEQAGRLQPDLVVSTGDLIDGSILHLDGFDRLLATIQAPLGKFAVTGNHEYYPGLEQSLTFHRQAGFTMLRGEATTLTQGLQIAGVDDPTGRRWPEGQYFGLASLPPLPADAYRILLKHQPSIDRGNLPPADLILAGHTHGGQIFPFHWLVARAFPFYRGLHTLAEGRLLYVSRGTGTWGPPFRVGSRPELTVIRLAPPEKAG